MGMKKAVIVFVFISVLFSFLISGVSAKDLFVSTTGTDSVTYANNDINNPWATPRKAWTEARAGDTVFFRGGTYTITSEIDTKFMGYDGTEQNPITFTNYQTESVTLDCGNLDPCFDIERTWNVVDGINFDGGMTVFRIGYNSLADHFTVQNCRAHLVDSTDNHGFVYISSAHFATVQNCIIEGPGPGSNTNVAGIIAFRAEGIKILNNEIFNVPRGIYYKHANPETDSGIEIAYNYFHDTGHNSIFSNSHYAHIHDNIIGRNNAPFKFNSANGGAGGDYNLVTHNTIYDVDLVLDSDDGGADYNAFNDNIIYSYTIESGCDGNTWDYNLHVTDSAIGSNDITGIPSYVGGSSPSTIADFALATGSPGKGAASDGKDIGADVSLVGPGGGGVPGCPEDWICTSWASCVGGQQTRTCTDQNSCGTINDKPAETQSCTVSGDECDNWQTIHPEWIFCDDFEDGTALERSGRYFEYEDNGGDFIIMDDVGVDTSKGMRALWQAGDVEAGNLKLGFGRNPSSYMDTGIRNTEDFRDIYYRMYLKMQNGWEGSPDKLSRATVISANDWSQAMIAHLWDNNYRLLIDPVECVDANNNVECVGYNDFNNMYWIGAQSGTTALFDSNHDDQWYCIEAHVRLNDPGQSNGIQEFWIDDQLETRRDGINFVRSYTDYGINAIFFENYWNSGSPQEQERYFDNIVVSTQRIGCVGTSSACQNSVCDPGECRTCPQDCSFSDCCPDGDCNNGETPSSCPVDCGSGLQTCLGQLGDVCALDETCPVGFVAASDTARCCPQSCQTSGGGDQPAITVDSTYSGYSTNPIDDGVIDADGGESSTWASEESTNPHWIEFDFGSQVTLSGITVHWAYNDYRSAYMSPQQAQVQTWTGSQFTTTSTITNSGSTPTSSATFTPVSTSRFRLYQPGGMGYSEYPNVLWVTEVDYLVQGSGSIHPCDTLDPIGCVTDNELVTYINLWKQDSTTYPMRVMMRAVALWKSGAGC